MGKKKWYTYIYTFKELYTMDDGNKQDINNMNHIF